MTVKDDHALRCMEIWGGNQAFDNAVSVHGIDAWIHSRPYHGDQSGGDIHYISTCGHGHIARFSVADVSGHGASVGEVSGQLRSLMRRYINMLDQSRFARALNKKFSALADAGVFATALLTSYYAPTDELFVCNAGHPPPLWYRADVDRWQYLTYDLKDGGGVVSNLPLGIIEPTVYQQFGVVLGKNDLVVLYTDAMIEAANPQGALLGPEGFLDLVSKIKTDSPDQVSANILASIDDFTGGADADDDVTLIVLHHNAADPPRIGVGEYLTVLGKVFGLVKV